MNGHWVNPMGGKRLVNLSRYDVVEIANGRVEAVRYQGEYYERATLYDGGEARALRFLASLATNIDNGPSLGRYVTDVDELVKAWNEAEK